MGKRGPKPRGEYDGKSTVLSTNITPELRARLDAEVAKSGLSLSREVEHRLRWSFDEDDKIVRVFGDDRQIYGVLNVVAELIGILKMPNWLSDKTQFSITRRAIENVLGAIEANLPDDNRKVSKITKAIRNASAGAAVRDLLQALSEADLGLPFAPENRLKRRAARIKADLGDSLAEFPAREDE